MSRFYETIGAYTRLSVASASHYSKRLWKPATLGWLYVVIGFATFGHVAAANYRAEQHEYVACDRARAALDEKSYAECWRPNPGLDAIAGMGAGAFWPLYLSWELQQ